ncbi:MAG: hypothetical protein IPN76_12155 [Saprospiraceae bacterium]|nr:hypothetical protein [Saprospiraceae bacterium]
MNAIWSHEFGRFCPSAWYLFRKNHGRKRDGVAVATEVREVVRNCWIVELLHYFIVELLHCWIVSWLWCEKYSSALQLKHLSDLATFIPNDLAALFSGRQPD